MSDDAESEAGWRRLSPRALLAWHLDNVIGAGLALSGVAAIAVIGWPRLPGAVLVGAAVIIAAIAAVESGFVLRRRWSNYRYTFTEDSVGVRGGAFLRHHLFLPARHVLYVEIHQGPVLRAAGLVRVRLGTIADTKSVGPLTRDDAEQLQAAVEANAATS